MAVMGLFEWIGIGTFCVLLISGLLLKLYTGNRVKKLDAFKGIFSKDEPHDESF